ncbi:MAG: hypothetical protein IJ367_01420, partial [Clostridia bacterium]|nr:hypothetical protein [Clostridia bacterium]
MLILAGINVFFSFLKEKPQLSKQKKIEWKNWIWIGLFSLAIRWLLYGISYGMLDTDLSFSECIRKIFESSGDSPHYLYLA